MKKLLVLGLAACVTALGATAFAGDEKEGQKPQMFMIYTDVVKPSMTKEYEAAIKHMVSEFAAYEIDPEKINWKVVSGPELGYAFVMPIENFAAVDGMFAAWEVAVETIGQEKFEAMMLSASEAMDHVDAHHVMHRPDLSYSPEEPAFEPEEVSYVHYSFYYLLPGKKKVMEEVAAAFSELYKEKGAKYGWSIYESVTGADLPLFIVAHPAESQNDFYAHREELMALLGDDAEPLREKVMTAVRRVEHMDGWLRPDLAYPQEEKHVGHDEHAGHKH